MSITPEQLDEMERGLEGVTPGGWIGRDLYAPYVDPSFVVARNPATSGGIGVLARAFSSKDAAHIARCDPDTIRELVRLARLGAETEKGARNTAKSLTSEEYKAQRESFGRHNVSTGDPRFD